jgi:hypothetical protein
MRNFFMEMVQLSLLSKMPREEPVLAAPDPNLVVDHSLPVKVFILTGQSNMQGHGRIWGQDVEGTVEYITKTQGQYQHLLDPTDGKGGWSTRHNVFTVHRNGDDHERISPLRVGAGNEDTSLIGPELQIGHILGESYNNEPILLIKTGTGNRALGWDFLPPGTPQRDFDGGKERTAAHGQCPSRFAGSATRGDPNNASQCGCIVGQKGCDVFWEKEACFVDNCWCKESGNCPQWYAGLQYDLDRENIHHVLQNLAKYVPGYQNQGFEVTGFFFWQGYSDSLSGSHATFYQDNLVRYIQSMRDEFSTYNTKHNKKGYVPPFVLATIGQNGCNESKWTKDATKVRLAQISAGETEPRVVTIDARGMWRPRNESPLDDLPHYHRNANVFLEVGTKLGWAMADMLQNQFRLEPPPGC